MDRFTVYNFFLMFPLKRGKISCRTNHWIAAPKKFKDPCEKCVKGVHSLKKTNVWGLNLLIVKTKKASGWILTWNFLSETWPFLVKQNKNQFVHFICFVGFQMFLKYANSWWFCSRNFVIHNKMISCSFFNHPRFINCAHVYLTTNLFTFVFES